jgi:glyoxylase-like metal-dependent hydrolase (beta-lactamase superfamily II)
MIKIGKYKIDVINLGNFALDGGAMFGVVPKNLWSKSYQGTDELNRIPLATRVMLIRGEGKIILVDTGNGKKMPQKLADIYKIDLDNDSLNIGLANFGLKKSDITDVILTHLHFDHCGGATEIINDKLVPTFSNAKYYVQKSHYNWALNPSLKDRASFVKDDYEPLIQEGILEFTDGEGELFEGIELLNVNGHTKDLQMVRIFDKSIIGQPSIDNVTYNSLIYPADLMPTSAHLPIPYVMGYDNYPLTTIEEKQKYIPKIFDDKTIICFEHDAHRQACLVGKNEKGYFVESEVVITE